MDFFDALAVEKMPPKMVISPSPVREGGQGG